jgi:hypothetical protein
MAFDFLKNLRFVEEPRPIPDASEGSTILVKKDGAAIPSFELGEALHLEYLSRDLQSTCFGFDLIDSAEWDITKNLPERTFLFGVTAKSEPKVDLFSFCRFTTDGMPKASVYQQKSPNAKLATLCQSFGFMGPETDSVVLWLHLDIPVVAPIAHLPKNIVKGANKGTPTYVRRENLTMFPASVCPAPGTLEYAALMLKFYELYPRLERENDLTSGTSNPGETNEVEFIANRTEPGTNEALRPVDF